MMTRNKKYNNFRAKILKETS